ncbi:MAG: hypothetical protein ABH879_02855 [archaeon]
MAADSVQVFVKPSAHFSTGDNVTIGGKAISMPAGTPITGRSVTVIIYDPSGSPTTLNSGDAALDSNGEFTSDTFTGTSSSGKYTAYVQLPAESVLMPPTFGYAFFFVEPERQYAVITDKLEYALGETAQITVKVFSLAANGTKTTEAGVEVPLKVLKDDGTLVLDSPSLVTGSAGTAKVNYTISGSGDGYGAYIIDIKSGKSQAIFKVPYFDFGISLLNKQGYESNKYNSLDNLSVRVVVSQESDGGVLPVTGASVSAVLKKNNEDDSGTSVTTFSSFTESSGTYTSLPYKLSSLARGDYYVEVTVTKSQKSVKHKRLFKLKTLDLQLAPVFSNEDLNSFLTNDEVKLGINVVDLRTGEAYTAASLTDAKVIGCKLGNTDCLSSISDRGSIHTYSGSGYTRFINFTSPSSDGTYMLTVRVNISTSSLSTYLDEKVYIDIDKVFATSSTKDRFANFKFKVAAGESVTFDTEAWLASNLRASVNKVTILDCKDSAGTDVTSQVVGSRGTSNSSSINITAPSGGGCYSCNIQVDSPNGTSFTSEQICVQKYNIWVDTKNVNGTWKWRYPSTANAYLHVNVQNDLGVTVPASKLALDVTALTNLITGQTYSSPPNTVLSLTSAGVALANATTTGKGKPIVNLSLSTLGLASGIYSADVEVTDQSGSVETGKAFFQISNLDVSIQTKRGTAAAWFFKPSDTITFGVTARYFNGSSVRDGSAVSLDKLLSISGGAPQIISSSVYTATTAVTSGGAATITVAPKSGKTLPSGDYIAFVKVSDGVTEIRETWFMVKTFHLLAINPVYHESSTALSMMGYALDSETLMPLTNVNVKFEGFFDSNSFKQIRGISAPDADTSGGYFMLNINSSPSKEGTYLFVVSASDGSSADESVDYLFIQDYAKLRCELSDSSQSSVSPGTSVGYKVTLKDRLLTPIEGVNVSISKFTKSDTLVDSAATTTSSGITSSNGLATITVKAPNSIGNYRPVVKANGRELTAKYYQQGMFDCQIGVWQIEADVNLYDRYSTERDDFAPGQNITVEFALTNPGGGAISMSELKLVQYTCIGGDCMSVALSGGSLTTALGAKKTSGFTASNNFSFTAPALKGLYVLTTQTKDTSNNRNIIPKTIKIVDQAKAQGVKYNLWMPNNYYAPSDPIITNISTTGRILVNASVLRNLDNQSARVPFSGSNITVTEPGGYYSFSVPNNKPGTYEATLCVYRNTCASGETRKFVFSVNKAYSVLARPYQPDGTYSLSEDVTLEIRLEDNSKVAQSLADEDVSVQSVRKGTADYVTQFPGAVTDSPNPGWKLVTLSHGMNLPTGDYIAEVLVDYGSTEYHVPVRFFLESYDLRLISADHSPGIIYSTDSAINFNVTAGGVNASGYLYIRDQKGGYFLHEYDTPFNLTGGFAVPGVAITSPGDYIAVAAVPDRYTPGRKEASYNLVVKGGFDVYMSYESMNTQICVADCNITLRFTLVGINGSPLATGETVNVSILSYRNPWNGQVINGAVGIGGEVTLTGGNGTYSFDPTDAEGTYNADVQFSRGPNSVILGLWFSTAGSKFHAYSEQSTYRPGENVSIQAMVEYGNGSGIAGHTIELKSVSYAAKGSTYYISDSAFVVPSDVTDAQGRATVRFVLPTNVTGSFSVEINDTDTGEIRTLAVSSSSYNTDIYEVTRGPYSNGEPFSLEIKVKDQDYNPVSGLPVTYTVRSEENNWNTVPGNDSVPLGTTNADGRVRLDYVIPDSFFGFYDFEINIDNGAVREWRGFWVSPFELMVDIRGEVTGEANTYRDNEIPLNAEVVVTVNAKHNNGSGLSGAAVAMDRVYQLGSGQNKGPGTEIDVTNGISITQRTDTTDSGGTADLRFKVANLTPGEEYDVRTQINVSGNSLSWNKWFRISSFTWAAELVADPSINDTEYYVVNSKGPGESVFVSVNITGDASNLAMCLERVESLFTHNNINYQRCYPVNSSTGGASFSFSAPQESGEYEAVAFLKNTQQGYREGEVRLWFKVLGGAEANFEMNTWIAGENVWAGANATVWVELWNRNGWQDVDEMTACGNLRITEVRDDETWQVVLTEGDITQMARQGNAMTGPPGAKISFMVPSLPAKNYNAKVECEYLGITRDIWFRVASFQVSSLMPEYVQKGQNVSYWIKATYANGTPLSNATLTVRRLWNNWNWGEPPRQINKVYYTDQYGEFTGSILAPQVTSRYHLEMEVTDGLDRQEIHKEFEIRGMNVDLTIGKGRKTLFAGDDLTITVMVSDQNGQPIGNSRVEFRLFRHSYEGGEAKADSKEDCHQVYDSLNCTNIGHCMWDDSVCKFAGEFCGQMNADADACEAEPVCWYDNGMEQCREDMSQIGGGSFNNEHQEKQTTYAGEAKFTYSGDKALPKGEYELEINVDAPGYGWYGTRKMFFMRTINVTMATDRLSYKPGETVHINITGRYKNGTPVSTGVMVESGLEASKFGMNEQMMTCMSKRTQDTCEIETSCVWFGENDYNPDCEMGGFCDMNCSGCPDGEPCELETCEAICSQCGGNDYGQPGCYAKEVSYDEVMEVPFVNGIASYNLTFPTENTTAGPAMIWADIVRNHRPVDIIDSMVLLFDPATDDFVVTVPDSIVSAGELFDVLINTSAANAQKLSISPSAMHMQSSGGAIPMQEMMGGGKESGKEDWYGSEIYLNPASLGGTHMMILARQRPGDYVTMVSLQEKGADFTSGENMEEVFFVQYTVNSSAGECTASFECNDNVSTTRDVCLFTKCKHYEITNTSECSSDNDCPNYAGQNKYGICNYQMRCENITGSCAQNSDCNDGIDQTYDYCQQYQCFYQNNTNVECTSSAQCTSPPDPAFIAFCEYGECYYVPPQNIECNIDSDCNQSNSEWCDNWDHQCHLGMNCNCESTSDCAEQPYGADTLGLCMCQCEYFNGTDFNWLYSWNKSRDAWGNHSGIIWGWGGTEEADEAKPFSGNPGGDAILALVAADTDYLYTQLQMGGFDMMGGLPYCGGSFPADYASGNIKSEQYVMYYDTKSGGSDITNISGADYRFTLRFTESPTFIAAMLWEWNSGYGNWTALSARPISEFDYGVECNMGTLDFKVNKTTINLTEPARIIAGVHMTSFVNYSASWTRTMYYGYYEETTHWNGAALRTFSGGIIDIVPDSGWQWTNDTGWSGGNMPKDSPPPSVCGDGAAGDGEECDDGDDSDTYYTENSGDDDGNCVIDDQRMGDSCRMNICGDGYLKGGEACDDSNNDNGDGCSASCQIEEGAGQSLSLLKLRTQPIGPVLVNDTMVFRINITNDGGENFTIVPLRDFYGSCMVYDTAYPPPDVVNTTTRKFNWTDLTESFGADLLPGHSFIVEVNLTANCTGSSVNWAYVENPSNTTGMTNIARSDSVDVDITESLPPQSGLSGYIQDGSGSGITGAKMRFASDPQTVYTLGYGSYSVDLVPGVHHLNISYNGLANVSAELNISANSTLNITMPAVGLIGPPIINLTSSRITLVIQNLESMNFSIFHTEQMFNSTNDAITTPVTTSFTLLEASNNTIEYDLSNPGYMPKAGSYILLREKGNATGQFSGGVDIIDLTFALTLKHMINIEVGACSGDTANPCNIFIGDGESCSMTNACSYNGTHCNGASWDCSDVTLEPFCTNMDGTGGKPTCVWGGG